MFSSKPFMNLVLEFDLCFFIIWKFVHNISFIVISSVLARILEFMHVNEFLIQKLERFPCENS